MRHQRGFSSLILICILVLASAAGYWYWSSQGKVSLFTALGEEDRLSIEEWGIELKVPPGLPDLVYQSDGYVVLFSTQSLEEFSKSKGDAPSSFPPYENYCSASSGPIGTLFRATYPQELDGTPLTDPADIEKWKEGLPYIDGYYYLLRHPQATCSDDTEVRALTVLQTRILADWITATTPDLIRPADDSSSKRN